MVCGWISAVCQHDLCFRTALFPVIRFSDWQLYPSYDSSHPFWVNTYRIIEKAHYEAEYYRLDVTAAYIDVSGLKNG